MTKVSFIGDSIRMQYAPRVAELLGSSFETFAPKENCRFAKYTLRGLFDWRESMKSSDIVHWNNGLWDICDLFGDGLFCSEEEYIANMLRIADILQKRHEIVIFATTTPVSEQNVYNKNSDIKRYNDILVPILRERGIIINDLYSAVAVISTNISARTKYTCPRREYPYARKWSPTPSKMLQTFWVSVPKTTRRRTPSQMPPQMASPYYSIEYPPLQKIHISKTTP